MREPEKSESQAAARNAENQADYLREFKREEEGGGEEGSGRRREGGGEGRGRKGKREEEEEGREDIPQAPAALAPPPPWTWELKGGWRTLAEIWFGVQLSAPTS